MRLVKSVGAKSGGLPKNLTPNPFPSGKGNQKEGPFRALSKSGSLSRTGRGTGWKKVNSLPWGLLGVLLVLLFFVDLVHFWLEVFVEFLDVSDVRA